MSGPRFAAGSGERRDVEAELISRLRALPAPPAPDERFLAELRTQLVAITPRIVDESRELADPPSQPARRGRLASFRRPLMSLAGAAAVLVILLGCAVWFSGGALPGQSLYGIKRASENLQLSLAGSPSDKAMKYLRFAASRAKESSSLIGSAPSDRVDQLVTTALRSADGDTRNGVRLLDQAAVSQHSVAPLAPLPAWLSEQSGRIGALARTLPAGPARSQAAASLTLLHQAAVRASQLKAQLNCGCLSTTRSDALGPLPCTSCPQPPARSGSPGSGGAQGSTSGTGAPVPGAPGSAGVGPAGVGSAGVGSAPASLGSTVPSVAKPGLPGPSGLPLPSGLPVPSTVPSAPATVGTGGAVVSLPGVGISLGTGGVGVSVGPTLP